MDQVILIDKPAGMSSFGVVARVRRELTEKETTEYNTAHPEAPLKRKKVKVGHTGTLDPFATGLLILLAGKATKRSNDFLKLDKIYEAEMVLGISSTTGDPEGELSESVVATKPTKEEIKDVFNSLTGVITQKVPAFSAVKINGQRAYKLARTGQPVATPERQVTIYKLELISYDFPHIRYRAHVSSGTYIRTLTEDIARKLGTVAYTSQLRRLQIGEYSIENAIKLEDYTA